MCRTLRHRAGLRHAGQTGRVGVLFHHQPQPKSLLFAIVGAEYVLNLLPRGTHEYAKLIRPSELAGYCRAGGAGSAATRGMEYNPLTGATG
jgi:2-polyprenyl-3-methyl-5-hydroxy-6-metoxy-1,4-benzoquinol methylase